LAKKLPTGDIRRMADQLAGISATGAQGPEHDLDEDDLT
jgi:hypothetical protein